MIKKNKFQDNAGQKLERSLEANIKTIKAILSDDGSLIERRFKNSGSKIDCCIFFIEGMADTNYISDNIIKPILQADIKKGLLEINILEILTEKVLTGSDASEFTDTDEIIGSLLYGDTVLLVDGSKSALVLSTKGWQSRSITEPPSEKVVRGPREGFVESLSVNISLLRRRINDSNLKFKFFVLGQRTKTKIAICYIEEIVSRKILDELLKRVKGIQIDGILDTHYIEALISDAPNSIFRTVGYSERPDTISSKLLEGRIAVICDGSPDVITVPYLIIEYAQVNEDYYDHYLFGTFNRLLRIISFFLSTSVPAIYLALTTYHQEILPTPLLLSISGAREGVPFPTVFEAFAMLLVFEILREAGIRLPQPIGQTISIVGALVLGQAAVTARIISAPMVIIVAVTGLSSFLIPKMIGPIVLIRFTFLLLASVLGLYGYIFGVIGVLIHLTALRSFGIPYLEGIFTFKKIDLQDTLFRMPWSQMDLRSELSTGEDKTRATEQKAGSDKNAP